jgi:hypothetical protein
MFQMTSLKCWGTYFQTFYPISDGYIKYFQKISSLKSSWPKTDLNLPELARTYHCLGELNNTQKHRTFRDLPRQYKVFEIEHMHMCISGRSGIE